MYFFYVFVFQIPGTEEENWPQSIYVEMDYTELRNFKHTPEKLMGLHKTSIYTIYVRQIMQR